MSVASLITQNFRNLSGNKIAFHPDLNFVVGDNGSGKSSLLEALFYLGHGKSFRTTKIESLVSFNQGQFVTSISDSQDRRMGISRNIATGQTEIRVDVSRLLPETPRIHNINSCTAVVGFITKGLVS